LKKELQNAEKPAVSALYEGTFSVGLDKKFIRIEPTDAPIKGALKLSINPFLIRFAGRVHLFDCGLGEFGEDTSLETIRKHLDRCKLSPFDVTDIFISHMHYDHLGGLAGTENGYLELTFPKANLWVNQNEWERVRKRDGATDDENKRLFFHFLDSHANLQMVKGDTKPYPEIRVQEVGGHTEFSQVLYLESGPHKYMMAGDIIGRRAAVQQKFTAKFDFDPKKSLKIREGLKRKAFEEGYVIMAYHETESPLFRIAGYDPKQGYTTETVESSP